VEEARTAIVTGRWAANVADLRQEPGQWSGSLPSASQLDEIALGLVLFILTDVKVACIKFTQPAHTIRLDGLVTIFAPTPSPSVSWLGDIAHAVCYMLPSQPGIGQVLAKCMVADGVIQPCLHMTT
jgi:hypothetical protein